MLSTLQVKDEMASRKRRAAKRLNEADRELVEKLSVTGLERLAAETWAALKERGDPPVTSPLTGKSSSPAEVRLARRANLIRSFRARRELLTHTLTVSEVSELLGIGRQAIHDRVRAKSLLAAKDQGRLRFPDWQFDPDGPDGVIEGLPAVLRSIEAPISPLARVRWFTAPKPLLGDRTPIEALRDGDTAEVVAEARSLGAS